MNYQEAMEYMEKVGTYGIVPGLDSIRELCRRLGNPQDELKFVHIAGTNGKGSTLAYISNILQAAGYRVGKYISPVIMEYRERFQINGKIRGKIILQTGATQKEAEEKILLGGDFSSYLENKKIIVDPPEWI